MAGYANTEPTHTVTGGRTGPALSVMTTIFFMWGFLTVLNGDILVPHLKSAFSLSYRQSLLVQFLFFIAYFVMSVPAARVLARVGYKASIVIGLVIMAGGAALSIPAAHYASFEAFLVAAFVLGTGITLLQVAANPYVAVLGTPATAPARLNLVQAFNTIGDVLAPLIGAYLIFGRSATGVVVGGDAGAAISRAQRLADARTVELPYVILTLVLLGLALFIARAKLPDVPAEQRRLPPAERAKLSLWAHRNLVWAVPAIFFYVAAEVSVGSTLVAFLSRPEIGNLSHEAAAKYVVAFWGSMAIGRFAASGLLRRIRAETALAVASLAAMVMVGCAIVFTGAWAMWPLLLVGLMNSLMFPTIFTLGIRGLGPLTEEGSGLLVMAIAGGALAYFQGRAADVWGIQASYVIPAACYLYILAFALVGTRATHALPDQAVAA